MIDGLRQEHRPDESNYLFSLFSSPGWNFRFSQSGDENGRRIPATPIELHLKFASTSRRLGRRRRLRETRKRRLTN